MNIVLNAIMVYISGYRGKLCTVKIKAIQDSRSLTDITAIKDAYSKSGRWHTMIVSQICPQDSVSRQTRGRPSRIENENTVTGVYIA